MPIPLALLAAGITAAGQAGSNLLNASSVQKTNQRQQDYNQQLYEKQRADALADWNMQNAYNSPAQQMQRFKEAGLNPNLIYGQMTNAPVVRSTDAKAPDFVAPRIDTNSVGNILGTYMNVRQQDLNLKKEQAAIDLLQEQTKGVTLENQRKEAILPYSGDAAEIKNRLMNAQIDDVLASMTSKRLQSSLYGIQAERIQEEIKTLIQNREWQNLTNQQKLQIGEIIKQNGLLDSAIKGEQITGQKLDNKVKEVELRLRDLNLSPNIISDLLKVIVSSIIK